MFQYSSCFTFDILNKNAYCKIAIAIIAAIPIIFSSFVNTNLPTSVSIGGTGLLIVVGVALETYKQLESSLVNRNDRGVK